MPDEPRHYMRESGTANARPDTGGGRTPQAASPSRPAVPASCARPPLPMQHNIHYQTLRFRDDIAPFRRERLSVRPPFPVRACSGGL